MENLGFWEYWVEDFVVEDVVIEPRLNELGKLKWELVSATNLSTKENTHIFYCIFKRPRGEPSPEDTPPY
jgi:hypothetical protein